MIRTMLVLMTMSLLPCFVCAAEQGRCEALDDAVYASFLASLGPVMRASFSQEEELSDAQTLRIQDEHMQQSFAGNGFAEYYPMVQDHLKGAVNSLTVFVLAAYSRLDCEGRKLPSMKELERPLAWCNAAASRAGSDDVAVKLGATYDCVIEVVDALTPLQEGGRLGLMLSAGELEFLAGASCADHADARGRCESVKRRAAAALGLSQ